MYMSQAFPEWRGGDDGDAVFCIESRHHISQMMIAINSYAAAAL